VTAKTMLQLLSDSVGAGSVRLTNRREHIIARPANGRRVAHLTGDVD